MPSEIVNEKPPFQILVIGGSYAGISTAVNLLDLCNGQPCRFPASNAPPNAVLNLPASKVSVRITVVDERDGFYHLIGSPLAFASVKYATKAWKRFEDIPGLQTPAIHFVQGTVTSVNCQERHVIVNQHDKREPIPIFYDYLIAASGLRRSWPTVPRALGRNEYLVELASHIHLTENAGNGVIVIGGGAVGIEMAAELKLVQPKLRVTIIHSKPQLLSSEPLPDEAKQEALSLIREAGVETVMAVRVTQISEAMDPKTKSAYFIVSLSDGRQMVAGFVINAVSQFVPTSSYLPIDVLDTEGYVKIKSSLEFSGNVPNAYYHHAAGDVASWPGIKRCGAAMHHGHYAAINIYQKMLAEVDGTTPQFAELVADVPPMMGLAVGNKALVYTPTFGLRTGADVLKQLFEDDLGYSICWNYMQLGDRPLCDENGNSNDAKIIDVPI